MRPIDVLLGLTQSVRLTEDEKEAIARAIDLYEALTGRDEIGGLVPAFQRAVRAHDALDGGPSTRRSRTFPWPTGVRPAPREITKEDR